jgi:hypothetical protein
LRIDEKDGPSAFYRALCEAYANHPPDATLVAVPMKGK